MCLKAAFLANDVIFQHRNVFMHSCSFVAGWGNEYPQADRAK